MITKLKVLSGMFFFISGIAMAQLGINTNEPDPSSALDITSTTKGLLIPRMSTTNRNLITNPATGLLIFNTTLSDVEYNAGTPSLPKWVSATTANNGLNTTSGITQLGGDITKPTAISGLSATNKLTFTGTGIDLFNVDNNTLSVDGTNNRIGIGTSTPTKTLDVAGEVKATRILAFGAGGINSNVAIGESSLASATNSGGNNLAVGFSTLQTNSSGDNNVAVGAQAASANTTGSNNIAFGRGALMNNKTGNNNVILGSFAGFFNGNGSDATTINESILIGDYAAAQADNQTNQIAIGSNVYGLGSNSVVLGNDSVVKTALKGNVGIGTTTPAAKLDVTGAIKIGYDTTSTTPSAGMLRYNATTNKFEGYDGSGWKPFN
ncbi:MAG: hypothetical protein RLY43_833 [Bacteroidota bacterium]|jgi:hypothetical protein